MAELRLRRKSILLAKLKALFPGGVADLDLYSAGLLEKYNATSHRHLGDTFQNRKFRAQREITLTARGMKLTRLCSHAPVAALLPARVGQSSVSSFSKYEMAIASSTTRTPCFPKRRAILSRRRRYGTSSPATQTSATYT